jgi:hypothetical protein
MAAEAIMPAIAGTMDTNRFIFICINQLKSCRPKNIKKTQPDIGAQFFTHAPSLTGRFSTDSVTLDTPIDLGNGLKFNKTSEFRHARGQPLTHALHR